MASSSSSTYDFHNGELWLVWSGDKKDPEPEIKMGHWSLMALHYPTTSDQREKKPETLPARRYQVRTEGEQMYATVIADSQFRTEKVNTRHLLSSNFTATQAELDSLASAVAPQQCQKWVICVLAGWAHARLVDKAAIEQLIVSVRFNALAKKYEVDHGSPALPRGITPPDSWPMPYPGHLVYTYGDYIEYQTAQASGQASTSSQAPAETDKKSGRTKSKKNEKSESGSNNKHDCTVL
ncbi:hypothetical protein B0H63DRAFT_564108 [Podospora didyma]|uniref:Uncharacterized protein n=1 Tax=Podospora didyma TaxID=330526 RepID=A0AAE0K9T9_9PEZI|nr:hypothetical protein B0H63DRAFT_564108 [Podospora didyma]